MATAPYTHLRRARNDAVEAPPPREVDPSIRVAGFCVASLLAHFGVAFVIPAMPLPPRPSDVATMVSTAFSAEQAQDWIEVEAPPEPEEEPEVEAEPEPEPEVFLPRPVREEPAEDPVDAVDDDVEAEPSDEPVGDPNATEGADDPEGEVQATVPSSTPGGEGWGVPEGPGTGGAQRGTLHPGRPAPSPVPAVDRRRLIRDWMRAVNRSIGAPVYTRTLQRSLLEGTVQVALRIDPSGRVVGVRIRRTSGHELVDEAALAHVRSHTSVPAPHDDIGWDALWQRQEITIPVVYRLAQR